MIIQIKIWVGRYINFLLLQNKLSGSWSHSVTVSEVWALLIWVVLNWVLWFRVSHKASTKMSASAEVSSEDLNGGRFTSKFASLVNVRNHFLLGSAPRVSFFGLSAKSCPWFLATWISPLGSSQHGYLLHQRQEKSQKLCHTWAMPQVTSWKDLFLPEFRLWPPLSDAVENSHVFDSSVFICHNGVHVGPSFSSMAFF
jgi:hypothetical protein